MKLEWTKPALADMQAIRDYIGRDSSYYAARFIEKVIASIEKLEEFPQAGRTVEEAENANLRELLFQNYRIMYQVDSQRVLILAVIHGARKNRDRPKSWEIY